MRSGSSRSSHSSGSSKSGLGGMLHSARPAPVRAQPFVPESRPAAAIKATGATSAAPQFASPASFGSQRGATCAASVNSSGSAGSPSSVAAAAAATNTESASSSIYGSNKVEVHSFLNKDSQPKPTSDDSAATGTAPKPIDVPTGGEARKASSNSEPKPQPNTRGYASSASVGSASAPASNGAPSRSSKTSVSLYRHPNSAQRRLAAEKRKRGQMADDGRLISRASASAGSSIGSGSTLSSKRKFPTVKLAGSFALNIRQKRSKTTTDESQSANSNSQFADPSEEEEEGSIIPLRKPIAAKAKQEQPNQNVPHPTTDADGGTTPQTSPAPSAEDHLPPATAKSAEKLTSTDLFAEPKRSQTQNVNFETPMSPLHAKVEKRQMKSVPAKGPPAIAKKKKPMTPRSQQKLVELKEKLAKAKQKKLEMLQKQQELQSQREEQLGVSSAEQPQLPQTLKTIAPLQPLPDLSAQTPETYDEEYDELPPITALMYPDIIIADLSLTGPEFLVRFPHRDFDLDLGRSALKLPEGIVLPAVPVYDDPIVEEPEKTTESDALVARKTELQERMDSLRQKLERKQKLMQQQQQLLAKIDGAKKSQGSEQGETIVVPKKRPPVMSKGELQKRKIQAQIFKDVSYLKHFVSKQQHLLAEVSQQALEHSRACEESDAELARTHSSLLEASARVEDLDTRHAAVSRLMTDHAQRILDIRDQLHQHHQ